MSVVVIDASVVGRWVLPDEQDHDAAAAVSLQPTRPSRTRNSADVDR